MAQIFLEKLGAAEPYAKMIEAPEEVEVAVRGCLFVLNYSGEAKTITLHQKLRNVYTGKEETGAQTLSGYETRVYES